MRSRIRSRGSSPLSRGTPRIVTSQGLQLRFIPALAGNTAGWSAAPTRRTVHPRSRGEHVKTPNGEVGTIGSSPLSRGTPTRSREKISRLRFIPALAGNTVAFPLVRSPSFGSSPLSRGTPVLRTRKKKGTRFIPALAGNTLEALELITFIAVHPRSRGEHLDGLSGPQKHIGSSPLSRGTPNLAVVKVLSHRFIPALAGNTHASSFACCSYAVHPRSRGEHDPGTPAGWPRPGSSPLSRGTRHERRLFRHRERFIPALAGNTQVLLKLTTLAAVHPRSRGEHISFP